MSIPKNSLFVALVASVLATGVARSNAAEIFSATDLNVNGIKNFGGDSTSQSFSDPVLTVTNTGAANFNAGIASQSDIDTLLGTSLLNGETVILTLTVDSIVGNLTANGLEFGISPNGTGFRPSSNLIFHLEDGGGTSHMAGNALVDANASAGFALTEASILDGFTATLTADQNGYTFDFTDVVLASGGPAAFSGTFSSATQFRDLFGGGHFYMTAQKTGTPNPMVINISTATINVIPEPNSFALATLGLLGLLGRRWRRKS